MTNIMKWLVESCRKSDNFAWGLTLVGVLLMVLIMNLGC